MTTDKLKEGTDLINKIKSLKGIINNATTQKCEWIEFTFGNGGNKATICDDENIIKNIRELALKENKIKLEKLEEQFRNL